MIKVFPLSTSYGVLHRGFRHTKFFCQQRIAGFGWMVTLPQLQDLSFGKFVRRRQFSKGLMVSTLPHTIINIILVGAKKQVSGIAAWWVVTFVQHPQTVRNVAMRKNPSHSVRHLLIKLATTQVEQSIPGFVSATAKLPTVFGSAFVYLAPKHLVQWLGVVGLPFTECTTKLLRYVFQLHVVSKFHLHNLQEQPL